MHDEETVKLRPSCRHIRRKLMYCDERHAVSEWSITPPTPVFFCVRTQDGLGPDEEPVSPEECRFERDCHRCGT